ncbi:hypothetical protein PWP93_17130 [Paraburkholderia sp. A1RI-2L]|uniref:hypothetical protein n=1 Tax=Paraburkholderia sp. A1RI-2L TaxID=3028367 RepID=UPI003B7FC41A
MSLPGVQMGKWEKAMGKKNRRMASAVNRGREKQGNVKNNRESTIESTRRVHDGETTLRQT